MDIFGKLKDIENIEWHWWANTEENFFNMNPPIVRPLDEFLINIRNLVRNNEPLVIEETENQLASIQKLCKGINKIVFGNIKAFPLPVKPNTYIFTSLELCLLLIEIDSYV